jgi:hypothetical protein
VNAFAAPAQWAPEMASKRLCWLTADACIIDRSEFFVRALLRLPVRGAEQGVECGVWVAQTETDFRRLHRPWNTLRLHRLAPTSGRLSSELPGYDRSTVGLQVKLHHRRAGLRPMVELEPSDHPLALDHRDGITLDRAREFGHLAA